jgi:hypothetical protein
LNRCDVFAFKIDSPRLKRTGAIHQVRKRCKKIRSVLRIVRPRRGKW